jgi:hypothetical protein
MLDSRQPPLAKGGSTCAAQDALSDDDFLKATFLELKTDNVEEMRQKIVDFGVKVLDVPDPHRSRLHYGAEALRSVVHAAAENTSTLATMTGGALIRTP